MGVKKMQDVFIIGAKGIGNYGGYETFLRKLIETDKNDKEIKYHIACKFNGQGAMDESKLPGAQTIDDHHFVYYNADCFKINILEKLGPAQAIYYDIVAFKECIRQIKEQGIKNPIVYVLAKWSKPVRKYWKISEAGMVKNADLLVCDSLNIEKYIKATYAKYNPDTTFIAYGADITKAKLNSNSTKVREWYTKYNVKENDYFLVVGRFVPENNYATMIMRSKVQKDLVLITNVEHNKFYDELKKETHFDTDSRIKFVGTVYDAELLKYIRENAFGYLHGHSVGGTNPSLLEALGTTKLNLLYDVGFNREVGQNSALYWNKDNFNLAHLLENTVSMSEAKINKLDDLSTKRIINAYSWELIVNRYRSIFLQEKVQ